jgi:hypothetical protein
MGAVWLLLLVPRRQSVAVPVEDLNPVASSVAEDVEVPRERVLGDPLADELRQAVEALAHVGGFGGPDDAECRGQAQHGRSSSTAMTRRKVSGSNPAPTTIRRPAVRTTSTPVRSGTGDVATTSAIRIGRDAGDGSGSEGGSRWGVSADLACSRAGLSEGL